MKKLFTIISILLTSLFTQAQVPILLNTITTNPMCFGDSTGVLSSSAFGGVPPFIYSVVPFYPSTMIYSNSSMINLNSIVHNVPAGCYTITVTDAMNNTATTTKCLTSSPMITIKTSNSPAPITYWNASCDGVCDGKIKPFATGGVGTKKDFYLYPQTSPSMYTDSVIYIGVATVTDSFFSNLCAGTYTVLAKDMAGCTTTATFTIAFSSNLNPTITWTGTNLTVSPMFSSYQWLLNGNILVGANSMSYMPTMNGNYSVIVSDSLCSDTSGVYTYIATGAATSSWLDNTLITPNPSDGIVNIFFPKPFTGTISVFDCQGKMVDKRIGHDSNSITMDLMNLNAGFYFILFQNDSGTYQTKWVKH